MKTKSVLSFIALMVTGPLLFSQVSDADYLLGLKAAMSVKFAELKAGNFQFGRANHLYILDRQGRFILISDGIQAGLWTMPEGELVTSFAPQGSTLAGPSPAPMAVRPFAGAISADGSSVALSNRYTDIATTDIYKNGKYQGRIESADINKIVSDREVIVTFNKDKKPTLYDLSAKKALASYGKSGADVINIILSPDKSKILVVTREASTVYNVKSGKKLLEKEEYLFGLTNTMVIGGVRNSGPTRFGLDGKEIPVTGWDKMKVGKEFFIQDTYAVTFDPNGPLYVFDIEKMSYVSERPAFKLNNDVFELRQYIPEAESLFVLNNQGYAGFGIDGANYELASGYSVNVRTGSITPYLWHADLQTMWAQAKSETPAAAPAPSPEVTSLLAALKSFPPSYKFVYTNFEFLDITNHPVATKYFTFQSGDKMMAIGKFCPSSSAQTAILALSIKNAGPNEQYNFMLINIGSNGIVNNQMIGTMQKVNGATTQVADLVVTGAGTVFTIDVTIRDSEGRERKSSYKTTGGCN